MTTKALTLADKSHFTSRQFRTKHLPILTQNTASAASHHAPISLC